MGSLFTDIPIVSSGWWIEEVLVLGVVSLLFMEILVTAIVDERMNELYILLHVKETLSYII